MLKEKRLYTIAVVGAIICFIGDNLLGYYKPAADFGNNLLFIDFSYEWTDVDPDIFVAAGLCGVISLLMMFAGFWGLYLRIKQSDKSIIPKLFVVSAFVFVSVGIMYHNVFAVSAYLFNRLSSQNYPDPAAFSMEVFNRFILVGGLAAIGYLSMSLLMFISAYRGFIYPRKWMCIINPLVFMMICVLLSKLLPKTAFVNGVFSLGQQSIGLFIVFAILLVTCKN